MMIGHLPAGFLLSRLLHRRLERFGLRFRPFLCAGMLGAIAPDADMIHFYLIDHGQHHHHTYFTHFPIVWIGLLAASTIWLWATRIATKQAATFLFALNGFTHMLLDSIVGDIWWLAPFIDRPFALLTVAAVYKPWWLNFVLHWSFLLELALVGLAIYYWFAHPPVTAAAVAKRWRVDARRRSS